MPLSLRCCRHVDFAIRWLPLPLPFAELFIFAAAARRCRLRHAAMLLFR
jgi:hypothetical protein